MDRCNSGHRRLRRIWLLRSRGSNAPGAAAAAAAGKSGFYGKRAALPELFQLCALRSGGCLRRLFLDLAGALDAHSGSDVEQCLRTSLDKQPGIPMRLRKRIWQLGRTLGRFDLDGQLRGIESAREGCRRELRELERNRQQRLRSYRTLGLCAGAALAILLL